MAPVELLVTHIAFSVATKQKEQESTHMCSSKFEDTVYPEGSVDKWLGAAFKRLFLQETYPNL